MNAIPRKPFWVKCPACAHCWPAAYSGMDVETFGHLVKRAACPMCGTARGIKVAKQHDGALLEPGAGAGDTGVTQESGA
jgi:hypothetical protein